MSYLVVCRKEEDMREQIEGNFSPLLLFFPPFFILFRWFFFFWKKRNYPFSDFLGCYPYLLKSLCDQDMQPAAAASWSIPVLQLGVPGWLTHEENKLFFSTLKNVDRGKSKKGSKKIVSLGVAFEPITSPNKKCQNGKKIYCVDVWQFYT